MSEAKRGVLSGEDIICFAGEDWWYHNPHSNLHLMKEFAKHNRILFVNSIGIRMPNLHDRFIWKRIAAKLRSLARYLRRAETKIYVLTPVALPLFKNCARFVMSVNTVLLVFQLRMVTGWLGMRQPSLWVCAPSFRDTAIRLRKRFAKCLVYYCVDNIAHFAGADREIVAEMECGLQRRADVALFVNHRLSAERASQNPRTYHLTHGVDFEHFAGTRSGDLTIPDDLRGIPRPIAGYIGEIKELDLELIAHVAAGNPSVSFVFVGEKNMDLSPLARFSNIHFLGKRPYAELPAYLRAFDCCCLYYRTGDAFNDYRNPKKLLEYLATGLPVISVRLFELEHFRDLVTMAETPEDFSRLLRIALAGEPESIRARRIDYAARHTWESVACQAAEHIAAYLNQDNAAPQPKDHLLSSDVSMVS